MSSRTIHKALFESAALMGASALQVYLLRRLFERKLTVQNEFWMLEQNHLIEDGHYLVAWLFYLGKWACFAH